ncbi:hypothetical protein Tco_1318165 [Tanacetum coccineum]
MISIANRRASTEASRSCPCAVLGAFLDSSEALCFSEARGSVLDRLRCVLAHSLTFFDCHFPLLNPFGVARVTTFAVACKAYGGEPTLPIFRSLCTISLASDWLTFQKRSGPGIPQIFDSFMTNIPNWKSEFIFVKETPISDAHPTLITDFSHGFGTFTYPYPTEPFDEILRSRIARHTFEAQTFSEPILYLASLASSWKYAPSAHSIFVDGEEMSFKNFMKKPGQTSTFSTRLANQHIDVSTPFVDHSKAIDDNDHVESSFVSKNQDVAGFELVLVGDSPLDQGAAVAEGSKKRRSITAALEEGATVIKLAVVGSSSKHESKRRKQEGPRRTSSRGSVLALPSTAPKGVGKHPRVLACHLGSSEGSPYPFVPASIYDVHALNLAVFGNILTNESVVVSRGYSKLKDEFVSLRSKNRLLEHEMSKPGDNLSKAQKNQDVEGSQIVKYLRSENSRILEELSILREVAIFAKDSRKKLSEELGRLLPSVGEVERLGKKCKDLEAKKESLTSKESKLCEEVAALSSKLLVADLERIKLVRDFLPLAALDEVHGLGGSCDFKDVEDYNPRAEKIFDEAAEAFYKLEFPYISLLVEKAGQSLGSLFVVDPPTIQEASLIIYDVHALNLAVFGNILTNESVVVSRSYSKLKDEFVSLRSKNRLLEHEMSKPGDNLSKAQKNQDVEGSQIVKYLRSENSRILEELLILREVAIFAKDSRKKLSEELGRVLPSVGEVERLGKKCKDLEVEKESLTSKESKLCEEVAALSSKLLVADLERIKLVRDFLPLAALDEVHGLGGSCDFKDVKDYNLRAKKIFDEAAKAFYKLEFPYISLFVEKVGQSLGSLIVVDPPTIHEASLMLVLWAHKTCGSSSTHPVCAIPSLFSNPLTISLFVTSGKPFACGWYTEVKGPPAKGLLFDAPLYEGPCRCDRGHVLLRQLGEQRMNLTCITTLDDFYCIYVHGWPAVP